MGILDSATCGVVVWGCEDVFAGGGVRGVEEFEGVGVFERELVDVYTAYLRAWLDEKCGTRI